jgi:hypothetical protein
MTDDFRAVWEDLNDVRPNRAEFRVAISEDFWKHNNYKHLCDRSEPWEDALPQAVASAAVALANRRRSDLQHGYHGDSDPKETKEVLQLVAGSLEQSVRSTLASGPVLFYRHRKQDPMQESRLPFFKWQLVLAPGLIFAIGTTRTREFEEHKATTSYFHGRRLSDPDHRFSALVENLVRAFCPLDNGVPRLPDENHIVRHGRNTAGIRKEQFATRVHIGNKLAWGFDENDTWSPEAILENCDTDPRRQKLRLHPRMGKSKR